MRSSKQSSRMSSLAYAAGAAYMHDVSDHRLKELSLGFRVSHAMTPKSGPARALCDRSEKPKTQNGGLPVGSYHTLV